MRRREMKQTARRTGQGLSLSRQLFSIANRKTHFRIEQMEAV